MRKSEKFNDTNYEVKRAETGELIFNDGVTQMKINNVEDKNITDILIKIMKN